MTDRSVALTVAGSDSGGGAGVQADLKTMEALGVFGTSAVTSVTAQNTTGVTAIEDVSTDVLAAQIQAVTDDFDVAAAKTGMLRTAPIIETVADALASVDAPVVVDPVMVAQSGDRLLAESAEDALRDVLLPEATLVTPNRPEAEVLTGDAIEDDADARAAAKHVAALGPNAVLVTGGHGDGDEVVDVLHVDGETTTLRNRRYDTESTHGSGCTVSAAIAARLAHGDELADAVTRANGFVARAIRYGLDVGAGAGPVHHLASLRNDAARFDAVRDVRDALRTLESEDVDALVPEVGTNVAVATPYVMDTSEVAAVEGRIHRTPNGVAAAGPPWLGPSSHVARLLLAGRTYDPAIGAAVNVRVDDEIVAAAEERLDVVEVDRTQEPDADPTEARTGGTMSWTVDRAMRDRDAVPDGIYDRGAVGKEPMLRLFAPSASDATELVLGLADAL